MIFMICAPKIFGRSNVVRIGEKHRQGFGEEISGIEQTIWKT